MKTEFLSISGKKLDNKTLFFKKAVLNISGILVASLLSLNLWAMDLSGAKNAGLLGEQENGYLGLVSKSASDDVVKLAKSVNSKRKTKYQEIATKKKVSLSLVEKQSGKKLIGKTQPGHHIKVNGAWKVK